MRHGKEDNYDNQIDVNDEPLDVDFVDMGGSSSYASVWTSKLLSEREVEELNCGGFGHGELEEAFVDEEGIPIMNNIEDLTSFNTDHEPSCICTLTTYSVELVRKLSISSLLCSGYDYLNITRACIATGVHSTYGGSSGSGGCEDDEPGDDEDDGEDEEDEDDRYRSSDSAGTDLVTQAGTDLVTQEGTDLVTREGTDLVTQEGTDLVTHAGTDLVTSAGTDLDIYDSWKSRMELYMLNRQQGRMILESIKQGPLILPSVEVEEVTRLKKYFELSAAEAIQADCDVKATN
nr:hypothetical protein [Tanacetum cinerariifolium]